MEKKKFWSVALIGLAVCIFSGCVSVKSDEQLITDRIQEFTYAYNSGDFEETLKSMDSKTRNTYHAVADVGSSLFSSWSGVSLDYSDLFALGVGVAQTDELMTIQIESINIEGEEAVAAAQMDYDLGSDYGTVSMKIEFELVKEKNDWYIKDLHELQEVN